MRRAIIFGTGVPLLMEQEKTNICFRRSLFAVADIAAGEALTAENVRSIRPAYGLAPKHYGEVIGKKAACDIKRGTPLRFEMIVGKAGKD